MATLVQSVLQIDGDFNNTGSVAFAFGFTTASASNAVILFVGKATDGAMSDVTVRDQQGNAYTRYIPSTAIPATLERENGAWFYKSSFSATQRGCTIEWTPGSEIFQASAYELSHSGLTVIGDYSATATSASPLVTISSSVDNLILLGYASNGGAVTLTAGGTASGVTVSPASTGRVDHLVYTLDAGTTDNPTFGGSYGSSALWGLVAFALQEGSAPPPAGLGARRIALLGVG